MSGFRYLVSDTVSLENVDEAEALRNTLDAMSIVGLSQQEQVTTADNDYLPRTWSQQQLGPESTSHKIARTLE